MSDTQSRVCVVTGGSSGIGAATVRAFAARGWNVAFTYLKSGAQAAQLLEELPPSRVLRIAADVSCPQDCTALASAVQERFGAADVLVNSAGTTRFVSPADLDGIRPEDFHQVYAVNVVGTFLATRAVLPLMRGRHGAAVVNVGSMAAASGRGSSLAYIASKGALASLTLALARQLGPAVRVNAVAPGTTDTRWLRRGLGDARYEAHLRDCADHAVLKAVPSPSDVAEAIWFLAVQATLTTGETVRIDGGRHLGAQ